MINKDDDIWAHYWDGNLNPVPCTFTFSNNQTLLRLWLSWHLPDVSHKVCPFKPLKVSNVEHIAWGPTFFYEMKLLIEVVIIKIESNPLLITRYRNGLCNIRELADIFQEVKDIFALANPKRRFDWIGQLSRLIFIRDTRLLKQKVPLDLHIKNAIPLNHNIQEDDAQTNQIDKSNSNINI